MKFVYGTFLVGSISFLVSLLAKEENPIRAEKNKLLNLSKQALVNLHRLKTEKANTIFHIGDSHIQIGDFTRGFRSFLEENNIPLQTVSYFPTNVFSDIYNRSFFVLAGGYWQGTTLTNEKNKPCIGIGGRNFEMKGEKGNLQIKTKDDEQISRISLLHANSEIEFRVRNAQIESKPFTENVTKTTFIFKRNKRKVVIHLKQKNEQVFKCYGMTINETDDSNLYYNSGVSGSKYVDFFQTEEFFQQLNILQPNFVFISLGTNDSYFLELDTLHFERNLDNFYTRIRQTSPRSELIVMTAPDTYYQQQNPPLLHFVNEKIRKVCQEQSILLWDWYEIMGGEKSILIWKEKNLSLDDLLHFNQQGYELIGRSFGLTLLQP